MSDPTPETLLASVNQIHERFMGMMGRVPEGITNDLAEVQLAAAAWEADRKRLHAMRLAAEQCDVAMDGASVHGLPQRLPKPYRQQWAEAHTALRAAIAVQAPSNADEHRTKPI